MDLFNSGDLCEGTLIGLGNPLLDISATVEEDLLKKYDLKPNDAIMADAKHTPLYKELTDRYKTDYIAGGSVQNTLRAVQWQVNKPKVTTYFGCVGNDNYAKILRDKAEADGVNVLYQVHPTLPTGTCAVLLTAGGTNRSLCANLGAAQQFTADHLQKPECKGVIETAKVFYTSGFFIAVSPESILQLAKRANEKNLLFVLNLSAPFVIHLFKEPLEQLMPYVDVLFGNQEEAYSFAKDFNLKGDTLEEIAPQMAELPKLNKNRSRVVVVTRSHDPVIYVDRDMMENIPVPLLPREKIVDTNGAGDAFTGGFLSQLLLGKSIKQCIQGGIYTAAHVIQQSGCTFVGQSDFKPDP